MSLERSQITTHRSTVYYPLVPSTDHNHKEKDRLRMMPASRDFSLKLGKVKVVQAKNPIEMKYNYLEIIHLLHKESKEN